MAMKEKDVPRDVITRLTVSSRYVGPPNVANGGYICGLMAGFIDGPADVMIRMPTPVDYELQVFAEGDGSYLLQDGEKIIVRAKPASLELEVPPPPDFQEAREAATTSIALQNSPYPGWNTRGIHPLCFCCGADGADEQGMKIHPGKINGSNLVAAPWIPGPELGDEEGYVRPEFIWTALDCPGAFAFLELSEHRPGMSGRIIGHLSGSLRVGDPSVVIAWPVRVEGRKLFAGTAVYNSARQLIGRALATWISLPSDSPLLKTSE